MRSLHVLHIIAVCLSLAQFEPRNVSFEILPTLADPTQRTLLNAYEFAPYIEIESPLYRAILNRDRKCVVWSQFIVRAEDCEAEFETDRSWWSHPELADYALESSDYRNSGYDRGHLRSLAMSRGSEHWRDTNHLAGNIIPERSDLNRGAIQQLESEICDLAIEHGFCIVTITMLFDETPETMPDADESHTIPSRILYLVESPAGTIRQEFDNE